MLELEIDSISDMHELASKMVEKCSGSELIGLSGELGAGKTEFAKGFLKSLSYGELVTSPSYAVQNIYSLVDSKVSEVHHFDCYRLGAGSGLEQFRENSLREDVISLIEWPEKLPELKDLLSYHIDIRFSALNTDKRLVIIKDQENA